MDPAFNDDSRRLAHSMVDLVFDHIQNVETLPVVDWKPEAELASLVRLPDEVGPATMDELEALLRAVTTNAIQLHHPSYMGHQVCPPLAPAVIADLVISALNQSTAVWEMSPIGTAIEKELIRWLARRISYPEDSGGTTVSGGSAANLTALLASRARWQSVHAGSSHRPVILCSRDTHYSVARAASIMGMGHSDVIKVATDEWHRMDLDDLEEVLSGLEGGGRSPLAIIASSGSTATGAFDHLADIADLRDKYRTWLHVDAAHGASVVLSPELRHLVTGIQRADSLSWDPHKMFWMPLSLGVVLVRNESWLRKAFQSDAPYLFHGSGQDLGEMTIQCSRRADAIKLWFTLQAIGVDGFVHILDGVTRLTRYLFEVVENAADLQAMHAPELNIFCFRYLGDADPSSEGELIGKVNGIIRDRLLHAGSAWLTTTLLGGDRVLRITLINPRTEKRHLDAMIEAVRGAGSEILRELRAG